MFTIFGFRCFSSLLPRRVNGMWKSKTSSMSLLFPHLFTPGFFGVGLGVSAGGLACAPGGGPVAGVNGRGPLGAGGPLGEPRKRSPM